MARAPGAPQLTAVLVDGPLAGRKAQVDAVEGRPPKTIDLDTDPGPGCRYVLAEWTQSGHSARYSYLYEL